MFFKIIFVEVFIKLFCSQGIGMRPMRGPSVTLTLNWELIWKKQGLWRLSWLKGPHCDIWDLKAANLVGIPGRYQYQLCCRGSCKCWCPVALEAKYFLLRICDVIWTPVLDKEFSISLSIFLSLVLWAWGNSVTPPRFPSINVHSA